MNKSVSFLLGAGFSAPMGYPVGNVLNNLLLNCTGDDFAFHTNGELCVSNGGKKPDFGYKTSYDFEFDFCRDLMHHFNKKMGILTMKNFTTSSITMLRAIWKLMHYSNQITMVQIEI